MTKAGRDDPPPERQRDLCQSCERRVDEVPDTIVAGPHRARRGGYGACMAWGATARTTPWPTHAGSIRTTRRR